MTECHGREHVKALAEIDSSAFPVAPWMFGAAGRERGMAYGTTAGISRKIGYEPQASVNNPYAQFQDEYTLDVILAQGDFRPADQIAAPPPTGRRRW